MITFIFRKRLPTVFSVEKIFDALYAHMERSGMLVRRLELPHTPSGLINVFRNAWFVARQRDKGVIHITGGDDYAALLSPFTPTLITVHDCVVLKRGTGLKRLALWLLWYCLPLRFASAVAVISGTTRQEVLETVSISPQKITVVPNFVDPALVFSTRPFARAQPRILHIGTTPNKNLPRVARALRGIACVLIVVGPISEDERRELEESAVPYENFVGVSEPQLAMLYHDADLISFPSLYEGFGMPIVEGQTVGRPVLTSDLEPMRSVAGEGAALLVDPYSVASIREGILALIADERMRERLIAAGRKNSARFTLDSAAASYRTLYDGLLRPDARCEPGLR